MLNERLKRSAGAEWYNLAVLHLPPCSRPSASQNHWTSAAASVLVIPVLYLTAILIYEPLATQVDRLIGGIPMAGQSRSKMIRL